MRPLHLVLATQRAPAVIVYPWNRDLVWLHVLAHALIALAFYAISFELAYFARRRRELPFRWTFWIFVVLIFACGTTHLLEACSVVYPMYWLTGGVKVVTAIASITTAIALVWLIPRAVALESEQGKFRALFESAPDAMVMLGEDGKIALVSTQTEKLFGYPHGELLGQPIEVLVPPRFRARHPALRLNILPSAAPAPDGRRGRPRGFAP